jgi:replication factor A1
MSVNVMDFTGQLWLSCFDEVGRMIMGRSADELMEIKEVDDKKVSEIFSEANCTTWNWKCKARMDTFQEQQRYVRDICEVDEREANEKTGFATRSRLPVR